MGTARKQIKLENLPDDLLWNLHRRLARRDPANSARLEAVSRTMRRTAPTNRANKMRNVAHPPKNAQPIGVREVKALGERLTLLYSVCKAYFSIPESVRKQMTRRQEYATIKKIALKLRSRSSTIKRDDVSFNFMDLNCAFERHVSNVPSATGNNDEQSARIVQIMLKYSDKNGIPFSVSLEVQPEGQFVFVWVSMGRYYRFYLVGDGDFTEDVEWRRVYTPYKRKFTADGHGVLFVDEHKKPKTQHDALDVSRLLTLIQKYEGRTLQFYMQQEPEVNAFTRKAVSHLDQTRFRERATMGRIRNTFAPTSNSNSNSNTNSNMNINNRR